MSNSQNSIPKKFIRIRNVPSEKTSNSLLYVQETGFLTSEHAGASKTNQINSFLFICVLDGKGIIELNGTPHNVSAGQCVFIDCKNPHSYRCDKNDPWELLWLHFNGISAQYYYSLFTEAKSRNCCVFIPQNLENIKLILNKIIYNNAHKSDNTEIINAKLITDLLTSVITNYCIYEEDESEKYTCKLSAVKDYLDNHFTESINLDKLSDIFYISKFYLTREFKKKYGITIIQYIINKRIEYAKELLRSTDKSIEEISEICGFNDPSYFSKQFKKNESITCLNYRKNNT
ncbi:AraC family transcriptional regulator [Porcipelethomonas sp.]|uniref:AraC family transcriptional regulator n=1 Tax=Porcipelethomonas sp. TaxID=2981675 RepID=UPI003EF8EA55